jgi:hypothetical protein
MRRLFGPPDEIGNEIGARYWLYDVSAERSSFFELQIRGDRLQRVSVGRGD